MTTRRKLTLLVIVPVLFATLLVVREATAPKPGTVEYHLKRFSKARVDRSHELGPSTQIPGSGGHPKPAFTIDYLKPRTWLWFLRGRPTTKTYLEEATVHREALLNLGYFEEREYVLRGKSFSMRPIISALAKSNTWISIEDKEPPTFTLTAPKAEMSALHDFISRQLQAPQSLTEK